MKVALLLTFSAILLISCQKDIENQSTRTSYIDNVKAGLQDSLSVVDFRKMDFAKAIITKSETGDLLLRIPFSDKKLSEEFVLLKTNKLGQILQGVIVSFKQKANANSKYLYNGTIKMSYLNRSDKIISPIKNGYITALHNPSVQKRMKVQPSANILPEVIVTCYRHSEEGGFYSYNSISLGSLVGTGYGTTSGTGNYNSGYYSSVDGGGGSGTGGNYSSNDNGQENNFQEQDGSDTSDGNSTEDEPDMVDFEFVEDFSPIDLTKYLKCFSNIPDEGSTCSIKILVDIPVDDHPNRLFNFEQGSPGHTFLQITKTNGSQTVTQNIGFYPSTTWKMLLTDPVKSKIVDNGEHEFNAMLKMNITPEKLNNSLRLLADLATSDYDIDEFNCADFALAIFNQSRVNPIEIPKYPIPGGRADNGTTTPGALYNTLKTMKLNGIESDNITFPRTKAFVGDSDGPCD